MNHAKRCICRGRSTAEGAILQYREALTVSMDSATIASWLPRSDNFLGLFEGNGNHKGKELLSNSSSD